MGPGEALAMMTFFLSVTSVLVLRGPLGKALAERISGRAQAPQTAAAAEVDRLQAELTELREQVQRLSGEVVEVQERLDFAERLLAQQKQQSALRPGS